MTDAALQILLREPTQAHKAITSLAWPWVKAQTIAGNPVVAEFRLYEDALTDKQRRYLHGYILKAIAAQAQPGGQRFPLAVWKEWYRAEFLGHKTVSYTNPLTGRKSRRRVRVSTEDLGVREYAEYIDRVAAHAATELGVEFVGEWTDPDTGEVFNMAQMRKRP